jgi:hypothetical protein
LIGCISMANLRLITPAFIETGNSRSPSCCPILSSIPGQDSQLPGQRDFCFTSEPNNSTGTLGREDPHIVRAIVALAIAYLETRGMAIEEPIRSLLYLAGTN